MQVACLTGNHQKEWRYYTHDVEAFLDAFNACLAGHPPIPCSCARTRIPTGTPCRDCSPKAQTSFIERRGGGGASDRRQEGVGVSRIPSRQRRRPDRTARAADVVPAHVIAVFIQGDARQQFERFAVARRRWRAGSASSA